MGTPPNITPEKRAAALKFARKALAASEAIHGEWIPVGPQRLKAAFLKPVNDHLRVLVSMLDDPTADHHQAAHDLGVVIAQLIVLDEIFLATIMDIERAREELIGEPPP
jgi:hypothetical protein